MYNYYIICMYVCMYVCIYVCLYVILSICSYILSYNIHIHDVGDISVFETVLLTALNARIDYRYLHC